MLLTGILTVLLAALCIALIMTGHQQLAVIPGDAAVQLTFEISRRLMNRSFRQH
jgi:hypothetical protein